MPLTIDLDAVQYATDQDILLMVDDDYAVVAPDSQLWAKGNDGAIDAADPFVMVSAWVDFGAAGVTPGRVIRLTGKPTTPANLFYGDQEYGIVEAVAGNEITIRRPGNVAGKGRGYAGPVVSGGVLVTVFTGITFAISTLDPQLQWATGRVRRALRDVADDAAIVAGLDDQDLVRATVAGALEDLYGNAVQVAAEGSTGPDPALVKAREWRDKYERSLSRTIARVRSTGAIIIV